MIKTIINKTVAVLLLAIALLFPSFFNNQNASASVIVTSPWTIGHGSSDTTTIDSNKLLYEGNVFTNSNTGSACPTSSFTKQTTTDNIFLGASGSSNFCRRGIYEFNLDGIPFDATITQVDFKFTVDSVSGATNCDFVSLNNHEPFSATASQLWTDVGANTVYVSNNAACNTVGVNTITLGSTANSNLQSQLNQFTGLSSGWFGLGIKYTDETRQVAQRLTTIGSTSGTDATRPQIIIYFTSNRNSILIGNTTSDVPEDGRSRKTVDALNSACSGVLPVYSRITNTSPDFTQLTSSNTGTTCNVLYIQFNTTAINDATTTVNNVMFQGVVSAIANGRNCDIKPTTTKPSTETDTNLWNNIQSSTAYISNTAVCATVGEKSLLLGSTANSDLYSLLGNNWFAVGLPFNNMTRDPTLVHTSNWRLNEDVSGIRPRINVQYTIANTYNDNIVTTDNTPTKSANKTFTDSMILSSGLIKSLDKTFADNMILSSNMVISLDKTFSESITLSSDIIKSFDKTFTESITLSSTILKSLDKTFNESINLASGGLMFDVSKSFDESLNILDGSNLGTIISGSFNEFVILMDNLETSTDDAGINWGMFAGLFVVIPMLVLLPIVAIKRRRR